MCRSRVRALHLNTVADACSSPIAATAAALVYGVDMQTADVHKSLGVCLCPCTYYSIICLGHFQVSTENFSSVKPGLNEAQASKGKRSPFLSFYIGELQ